MAKMKTHLSNLRRSLADLLGADYLKAVCEARAFAEGADAGPSWPLPRKKWTSTRLPSAIAATAWRIRSARRSCPVFPLPPAAPAAASFLKASRTAQAPLTGYGCLRIGEDGMVYLISKSEHYHASLGHDFPGYRLIENAKKLGIPNVTHNNTRGHITRLLEEELVRTANGLKAGDRKALERVLDSREPHTLNRVINLETGSLAVEAALKMMLARFYRLHHHFPLPPYHGRVPVFLVMADHEGGRQANYHGTTLLTQAMRGMWPELYAALDREDLFLVQPVRLNDAGHFEEQLLRWESGKYKVAGFFHEIILMNYGGIRLKERFLARAYELCRAHDVPTVVDEIQSCIWCPELFLFREYGLKPDFVSVGKGFPGGEYPASRILFSSRPRHPAPVRRAGHQRAGGAGLAGLPDHHGVRPGQRRLRARAGGVLREGAARPGQEASPADRLHRGAAAPVRRCSSAARRRRWPSSRRSTRGGSTSAPRPTRPSARPRR